MLKITREDVRFLRVLNRGERLIERKEEDMFTVDDFYVVESVRN